MIFRKQFYAFNFICDNGNFGFDNFADLKTANNKRKLLFLTKLAQFKP